jgi:hypothetical protein
MEMFARKQAKITGDDEHNEQYTDQHDSADWRKLPLPLVNT